MYAPRGPVREEFVGRVVALMAVLSIGVYLSWRAVGSWQGIDLKHFLVLYIGELVALAMLVSLCALPGRISKGRRPTSGRLHAVDVIASSYGTYPHIQGATLLGGSQPAGSPRHSPEAELGFEDLWFAVAETTES